MEVKLLFHHLLGIPILDIADDHQEVLAFSGLKSAEMADSLYCSVSVTPERVDAYYDQLFPPQQAPSLLNLPNKQKIQRIVEHFEATTHDDSVIHDVQTLFSHLLAIPEHDIPDGDPAVAAHCLVCFDSLPVSSFPTLHVLCVPRRS